VTAIELEQTDREAVVRVAGAGGSRLSLVEFSSRALVLELLPALPDPAVGDLMVPGALIPAVLVKESRHGAERGLRLRIELTKPVRYEVTGRAQELLIRLSLTQAELDLLEQSYRPTPVSQGLVNPGWLPAGEIRALASMTLQQVAAEAAVAEIASLHGAPPHAADAPRQLTEITVEPIEDDSFFLLIGSGPLPYRSSLHSDPLRFVLELDGVALARQLPRLAGGPGLVRAVEARETAGPARPRVEVTFHLNAPALPVFARHLNELALRFGPLPGAGADN
jgi:hypothetical protein